VLSLTVWAGAGARAEDPVGPSVFRAFGDEEGFANPVADVLFQDRVGFLWIATADGLFRYDGRAFTRFVHPGTPRPHGDKS